MKSRGIDGVIVHARYGLPEGMYLSEEWFRCFRVILETARELGIKVVIYDEKDWPSGTRDGSLTKNRELAAKQLVRRMGRVVKRMVPFRLPYRREPYIDVLHPEAAELFIVSTHQLYEDEGYFSEGEGRPIGIFTDEPGLAAGFHRWIGAGSLPYSSSVEARLIKLGYDPQSDLKKIWQDRGAESRKIRLDYWQIVSDLYIQGFLEKLWDWCDSHGLLFTGHLFRPENPLRLVLSQGDPFLAAAVFDWPGYDVIGRFSPEYLIAAIFARSVAKIYNKPGILTEAFGGFGRKLTLDEIRRIISWLVRQGTTVLVPHALHYSDHGESPPSLMEEPYWSEFAGIVEEFRDMVKETSLPDSKIAIYFPVPAFWAVYNPVDERAALEISETIKTVSLSLGDEGVRFDYLNDYGISTISGQYEKIIIPRAEVMPLQTLQGIFEFIQQGGEVDFIGSLPRFSTKEKEQEEFGALLKKIEIEIGENEKVRKVTVEVNVSASRIQGLLQYTQHKVWYYLSRRSPRSAQRFIDLKHKILTRISYLTPDRDVKAATMEPAGQQEEGQRLSEVMKKLLARIAEILSLGNMCCFMAFMPMMNPEVPSKPLAGVGSWVWIGIVLGIIGFITLADWSMGRAQKKDMPIIDSSEVILLSEDPLELLYGLEKAHPGFIGREIAVEVLFRLDLCTHEFWRPVFAKAGLEYEERAGGNCHAWVDEAEDRIKMYLFLVYRYHLPRKLTDFRRMKAWVPEEGKMHYWLEFDWEGVWWFADGTISQFDEFQEYICGLVYPVDQLTSEQRKLYHIDDWTGLEIFDEEDWISVKNLPAETLGLRGGLAIAEADSLRIVRHVREYPIHDSLLPLPSDETTGALTQALVAVPFINQLAGLPVGRFAGQGMGWLGGLSWQGIVIIGGLLLFGLWMFWEGRHKDILEKLQFKVLPAELSDADRIYQIIIQNFLGVWSKPHSKFLNNTLALRDRIKDEIIGFIHYYLEDSRAILDMIGIARKLHNIRHQYDLLLVNALFRHLAREGITEVEVSCPRFGAIQFYKNLGFSYDSKSGRLVKQLTPTSKFTLRKWYSKQKTKISNFITTVATLLSIYPKARRYAREGDIQSARNWLGYLKDEIKDDTLSRMVSKMFWDLTQLRYELDELCGSRHFLGHLISQEAAKTDLTFRRKHEMFISAKIILDEDYHRDISDEEIKEGVLEERINSGAYFIYSGQGDVTLVLKKLLRKEVNKIFPCLVMLVVKFIKQWMKPKLTIPAKFAKDYRLGSISVLALLGATASETFPEFGIEFFVYIVALMMALIVFRLLVRIWDRMMSMAQNWIDFLKRMKELIKKIVAATLFLTAIFWIVYFLRRMWRWIRSTLLVNWLDLLEEVLGDEP